MPLRRSRLPHLTFVLIAAGALPACSDDDDGLEDYDLPPTVERGAPGPGARIVFRPRRDGGGARPDAGVDGGSAGDAAPADATTPGPAADAGPSADAGGGECVQDDDCAPAVDLRRCETCPVALPASALLPEQCVVRFQEGETLFGYDRPDCVVGCPFNTDPCVDTPTRAVCRGGLCALE